MKQGGFFMIFSFSELKTHFYFLFQQLLLHNFFKLTSVALYTTLPVRLSLLFCTHIKCSNRVRTVTLFPLWISPESLQKSCSADVEREGSFSLSFNCFLEQLVLLSSGSFPSLPFPHLAACWLVLESLYC